MTKFTPVYIVEQKNLEQLKQSLLNEFKNISLIKKDRNFLLSLIELFDWLSEEDSRFLNKLEKLIAEKNIEKDDELKVRLQSLQTQINSSKNIKIVHFPTFSMYFQIEKIEIYLKKLPASWNNLIEEIKKTEFEVIYIDSYKSITKKEKLSTVCLNKKDKWGDILLDILDKNIYTNLKITLVFKKEKL